MAGEIEQHPLSDVSIRARHFKCFGNHAGGWSRFEPINVVVGKNNSGKSTLIDLLELCISKGESFDLVRHGRGSDTFEVLVSEPISENTLRQVFQENVSGGDIGMNHWQFGQQFVDNRAMRSLKSKSTEIQKVLGDADDERPLPASYLPQVDRALGWRYSGLELVRVAAERDVLPEVRDVTLKLEANGRGVTNVIRAFITSDRLDTELVTRQILEDLNFVYANDSTFDEITCLESDEGLWEIFLRENNKGNIRLSQSGSSLKTVFLVLSYFRLFPKFTTLQWSTAIFCIEEPENNLHPALLRRLLEFLARARNEAGFTLVLTSHSPVCIDWAAKRQDTQIIHVNLEAGEARASVSLGYKHNRGILDDLDVRASDILQSNGIVWVEGPSDRVYVNRWIELVSEGEIKEGLHYQVMFYAGKLLFHLNALPPDETDTLISLLGMNRNIALVMDSDRHLGAPGGKKPRVNLNRTKRRVRDEFLAADGFVWVTDGREVENYISERALHRLGRNPMTGVGKYDKIPESGGLSSYNGNKMELAHAYSKIAISDDLDVLDLNLQVKELMSRIRCWNAI